MTTDAALCPVESPTRASPVDGQKFAFRGGGDDGTAAEHEPQIEEINAISAARISRELGPVLALAIAACTAAFVAVAARRLLLNLDARASFFALAALGAAALVLGLFFDRKAGYCNAICPMIPSSGCTVTPRCSMHRPLAAMGVRSVAPGARGCLDLTPTKSIAQVLGPARRSREWLRRPSGVFSAAFPGLALGYFLLPDSSSLTAVALTVGTCSVMSYLVSALAVVALRVPYHAAITALAVAAMAIF